MNNVRKRMETIMNIKAPTIDSKLLISLSKSGRNVLAYIIDSRMTGSSTIMLDKLDISNYIASHVGKKEANTWNVDRGIKDLISNGVLDRPPVYKEGLYNLNLNLLSK